MTARQEPLAEQQFKNIQSFKGEKASDVIPAMEFMCASLKEPCDYCHVADRSSDEKNEKKVAREMIAMQRDINNRNFHGRNQVTCATCHAGSPRPVNLPPMPGIADRARRSADVSPDQVLAAYGKAVGADAAASITTLRFEGTNEAHGERSKVETTYAGGKYLQDTEGTKQSIKQGFNGDLLWYSSGGGVQRVPLVYGAPYVRLMTLYMGPATLPKLDNPTGGTAQINGRDALVVSGTLSGEKTRVSLFFDKQSGLLVRSAFYYPSILGSIPQINDYSDYRRVNGVELPMTVGNHSNVGDSVSHYRSVQANPKLDASVFDPPK